MCNGYFYMSAKEDLKIPRLIIVSEGFWVIFLEEINIYTIGFSKVGDFPLCGIILLFNF